MGLSEEKEEAQEEEEVIAESPSLEEEDDAGEYSLAPVKKEEGDDDSNTEDDNDEANEDYTTTTRTTLLTAGSSGGATTIDGCQHCRNVKLQNKILYKCGTEISKFFPLNENNPTPGWYKGTITNHYIATSTTNQQQRQLGGEEVAIWNEIQFEDGDMERIPQEELLQQQIRVLQRVSSLPKPPSSSRKKRKREAAAADADDVSDDNKDSNAVDKNPVDFSTVEETFNFCGLGHWKEILERLQKHPDLGMTIYKHSTLLFHAIHCTDPTSSPLRTQIILLILQQTPKAASITNSHGATPLHAMCSRNVRFFGSTKEQLRKALIQTYPMAILIRTNKGKTPLHILMGDSSQEIMELLLLQKQYYGEQATHMKDSQGRLPIHEAAKYRPSKYQMELLLQANPSSIAVKDLEGKTVLDLVQQSSFAFDKKKSIIKLVLNAIQAYNDQQQHQQANQT